MRQRVCHRRSRKINSGGCRKERSDGGRTGTTIEHDTTDHRQGIPEAPWEKIEFNTTA